MTVARLFRSTVLLVLLISLAGCNLPGMATPTPYIKYITRTPLPATATPPPTDTPLPSPTFTLAPTATLLFVVDSPIPTQPPQATVTVDYHNAILVYFFNLDVKGPYGCGEQLMWINTGRAKSGNTEVDLAYALRWLFSYHNEKIGKLYNPGWKSTFAVGWIKVDKDYTINVNITGTYVPTKNDCDRTRLRDQIKMTVMQFAKTKKVNITLNGTALADALSRSKK